MAFRKESNAEPISEVTAMSAAFPEQAAISAKMQATVQATNQGVLKVPDLGGMPDSGSNPQGMEEAFAKLRYPDR